MDDDKAVEGCLVLLIWFFIYTVLGSFWGDYSIHFWLKYFHIKETIPYWLIFISALPLGKVYWFAGIITFLLSFVL